jgi:hypothetical protein
MPCYVVLSSIWEWNVKLSFMWLSLTTTCDACIQFVKFYKWEVIALNNHCCHVIKKHLVILTLISWTVNWLISCLNHIWILSMPVSCCFGPICLALYNFFTWSSEGFFQLASACLGMEPLLNSKLVRKVHILQCSFLALRKLVCLFVLSHTSNFSAIWRLSPLPGTGLQI